MKKVLFVATVTKHINTFHIPYLKLFKEQGYEVHVASNGDEKIEYCDKHFNLPFERFPVKLNNIKVYKELKKIIDENQYEIVHSHTPVGGVLARLATRKARKKYATKSIYTAHGFHFYKGAPILNWIIYYPIEKICSRWTDYIITINKEDFEFAKKNFSYKFNRVEYTPGVGVDFEKFRKEMDENDKAEYKKMLNLPDNSYIISYVARLDKNKNQKMLIEAMEYVLKKHKNVHLLLIGEDELNGQYQKLANEKNISTNIHFLGNRNDVSSLLHISDMACSTSIREGLPINVIEYIAAGIPVVAKDNRGHRDIIKEQNGFLIENEEELIQRIFDIYEEKARFNKVDLSNSINEFKLSNVLTKMREIYNID